MQLDLFHLEETNLEQADNKPTSHPAVAHVDAETDVIIQSVLKEITKETETKEGFFFEEIEPPVVDSQTSNSNEAEAYEVNSIVTVDFPTEESDFELYNYLHYYYPHIKGKKRANR